MNIQQLEDELWEAADQLRANSKLTASEYSMTVLGLIFLRHADNRYKVFLPEIVADIPRQVPAAQREELIKLGFSPHNPKYMRAFAQSWPDAEFVQQAAAQLPWLHLCTLIDKPKTRDLRDWYLAKAIEHQWSRNVLEMRIETHPHARSGQAVTNFETKHLKPESDLARESLKDPYDADEISLKANAVFAHIYTTGLGDGAPVYH